MTLRFGLGLVVAISVVFTIGGFHIVQRELAFFEAGEARDKAALGLPLAAAVTSVWRDAGEDAALSLLAEVNLTDSPVRLRWVRLSDEVGPYAPTIPSSRLAALAEDSRIISLRPEGGDTVLTYVPARLPDGRPAAIEIVDSLNQERAFARSTGLLLLGVFSAMALVTVVLAALFGYFTVGRPVHALVDKTRRIARADWSQPLDFHRSDELGQLAREIDLMCDQLEASAARVEAETTARIEALGQLRHAERLATVGKLAAGVAHELGTPLNVVSGRSQMIEVGPDSAPGVRENARIIREQTDRMTGIIRQLLDFARRRGPTKSSLAAEELVSATIELLEPLAKRARVGIASQVVPPDLRVEVDRTQFQQVLANVLANAIEASEPGGRVQLRVAIWQGQPPPDVVTRGSIVAFEVRDDGAGIAEPDLPRVFEPFFTTKDVGEGTGLGLSVSHGIVQDHDGWIDVSSRPAQGTIFVIGVPQGEV